jgi:predicted dehydrogenase
MKAVVQSYSSGQVRVAEVPAPRCPTNGILVRTAASLVSIGTERSIIELGRKSLLGKARARPDLVKRALEKAKREGFWKTFQESLARLDAAVPLGYSSTGIVVEVGAAAHGFSPGDRVACVGHAFASHAEFAAIPANLACRIPESVNDEEAAFCMLGAIAMHGVRSTQLGLGGTVAVIGLGLLGILAAQILRAYGCQVVGMDTDASKVLLCREFGFADAVGSTEELQEAVTRRTGGAGCDAVVIAAATKSSEPVATAVGLCRQGGRVVILGVADIHPNRNEMWNKEVEIVVSKAGGLGALDPVYELDGIDLPIGVARWTQGRNVEEFLRLVAEKTVTVDRLVTHRSTIADAESLYGQLIDGKLENVVGVVLTYPATALLTRRVVLRESAQGVVGKPRLAVLGAGLYGKSVFLPALAREKAVDLNVLVTSSGVNGEHAAKRFGFRECSTEGSEVLARPDVDAVVALLPHSQHARTVLESIRNGKHLLIEKPLCVSPEELDEIEKELAECANLPVLMVGHNRRYSPHIAKIRSWLERRSAPLVMTIRINAGFVPPEHWVHRESEGRSRIVGEGTHFIDLASAIIGAEIVSVDAVRVHGDDRTVVNNDNYCAQLAFADGSIASLVYTAQGPRTVSREAIEIFSEGTTIASTDFRTTERYTASGRTRFSTRAQNYGYEEEISRFVAVVRGQAVLEPTPGEMIHTMRIAFAIERSLAEGRRVFFRDESV